MTLSVVPQTRESLIGRTRHQRDEIIQYFADVAHWNANHPPHEQVEADPDGSMRRILDGLNTCLAGESQPSTGGAHD